MANYDFDIGILGGGAAGLTITSGAAQFGAKTPLIEREKALGGDCLHFGCVPSKTLIRTANVYHLMKNAEKYGLPTFVWGLRPASIEWPPAEMPYRFDAKSYLDSARAMRHFYEARLREPLFVFSTKVGLWLTGGQDTAVSVVSSLFGALVVLATYALSQSVGGAAVGLVAAFLMAIEPQMLASGLSGYRDDLFTLLAVLFAWACVRLLRALSVRTVLLVALTGAAACLTRITALTFVIPGLAAAVAFCPPSRRHEAWRRVLAAGALSALLIAPFLFNCWVEFGDPLYSITYGFAIGKNASPEAIDFVKYLTTAEAQQALVNINVAIPVVKGGEVGMTDPLMITLQQSLANAEYFQLYYDQALPPAMGSVINDSVQGIFAGTLTPEQAAQAIEDSAAQELK